MSDKIELTREQFTETANKIIASPSIVEKLKLELFGPKKPREWDVTVLASGSIAQTYSSEIGKPGVIRVREVLSDGE